MKSSRLIRYAGLGTTFVLTLISASLLISNDHPQCLFYTEDQTWIVCTQEFDEFCGGPAYQLHTIQPANPDPIEFKLICPWQEGTSIFGFISAAVSIIFVFIWVLSSRFKSFRLTPTLLVTGVATTVALFATFIMMIIDLVNGKDSAEEDAQKYGNTTYTQKAFVIDTVLYGIVLVLVAVLTVYGYKKHSQYKRDAILEKELHYVPVIG